MRHKPFGVGGRRARTEVRCRSTGQRRGQSTGVAQIQRSTADGRFILSRRDREGSGAGLLLGLRSARPLVAEGAEWVPGGPAPPHIEDRVMSDDNVSPFRAIRT